MEMYFRAMCNTMIKENDIHGNQKSCGMDQGRHIALIRTNRLFRAPKITRVIEYIMGEGNFFTLGIPFRKWNVDLNDWKNYNTETREILNHDGTATVLVHMFDRNLIFNQISFNRTKQALIKWQQKANNSQ